MLVLEKVLEFVAPHECLGCGVEGSLLCVVCAHDQLLQVPDRCYRCLRLSRDCAVCSKCRSASPLRNVWVVTDYDGVAKQLVQLLKFERTKDAAKPIAQSISGALPYFDSSTIVAHIPTATARQRSRGYDQSDLIARIVAKNKKATFKPLLGRFGQSRQVGASRKQRFTQVEGIFYPLNTKVIKGANVILVDDILTTGATLEAAAKTIRSAGAKSVSAVVFAQKH